MPFEWLIVCKQAHFKLVEFSYSVWRLTFYLKFIYTASLHILQSCLQDCKAYFLRYLIVSF